MTPTRARFKGQPGAADVAAPLGRGWTRHATERAWQRHGIAYDASQWRAALLEILEARQGEPSRAVLVGSDPARPGRMIYHVPLAGVQVRMVYDPETCVIITVLDRAALMIGTKRGHAHSVQKRRGRERRERRGAIEWDEEA